VRIDKGCGMNFDIIDQSPAVRKIAVHRAVCGFLARCASGPVPVVAPE
jgi:hypothetical protein